MCRCPAPVGGEEHDADRNGARQGRRWRLLCQGPLKAQAGALQGQGKLRNLDIPSHVLLTQGLFSLPQRPWRLKAAGALGRLCHHSSGLAEGTAFTAFWVSCKLDRACVCRRVCGTQTRWSGRRRASAESRRQALRFCTFSHLSYSGTLLSRVTPSCKRTYSPSPDWNRAAQSPLELTVLWDGHEHHSGPACIVNVGFLETSHIERCIFA